MTQHDKVAEAKRSRCQACGIGFSMLTLAVNLAMALLKVSVGWMAGSRALIASALYSINDVLSAIVVLVSLRVARRPADAKHAYGYGNAEYIAIGLVSVILAVGVIAVLFHSIAEIIGGVEGPPHVSALLVALVTLVANSMLAARGHCAARHIGSPALETSAQHNHADALSSLAVAVGIGAAFLGVHVLDPAIAIFETVHVMWLGGALLGRSLQGLSDSSLPGRDRAKIATICNNVSGVAKIFELRTRRLGPISGVDLVVGVSDRLSVEEATAVTDNVRAAVRHGMSGQVEAQVRFRSVDAPEGLLGSIDSIDLDDSTESLDSSSLVPVR